MRSVNTLNNLQFVAISDPIRSHWIDNVRKSLILCHSNLVSGINRIAVNNAVNKYFCNYQFYFLLIYLCDFILASVGRTRHTDSDVIGIVWKWKSFIQKLNIFLLLTVQVIFIQFHMNVSVKPNRNIYPDACCFQTHFDRYINVDWSCNVLTIRSRLIAINYHQSHIITLWQFEEWTFDKKAKSSFLDIFSEFMSLTCVWEQN